jgi:hypothetical protein
VKVATTTLVLGLLLAGCKSAPAGDPNSSTSEPPPTIFVEAPPQTVARAGEDPPVAKITAGECPGEVGDFPEPYFRDRVLIRLPKPLTADDVVETAPNFAQLTAPMLLSTCKPEWPHALLEHMTFTLLDPDPGGPIEVLRDDVLRANGLDGTLVEAEIDAAEREAEWVFETTNSKRLVVLGTAGNKAGVLTFDVAATDWPLVVNSLRESAKRVSFLSY